MSVDFITDETEIGRMAKNATSEIVGRLLRCQGHRCADVRIFVPGSAGQDMPTKAGMMFLVGLLPEFKTLVDKLIAAAEKAGETEKEDTDDGE